MSPAAPAVPATDSPEALARVVTLLIVADTRLDPRELDMLDQIDAFTRLGLGRAAFMQVARDFCDEIGDRMAQRPWLTLSGLALVEEELARVRDPDKRLCVCRIAAAVITADGRVQDSERRLFDHLLLRWGLSREDVTRAILADRPGKGA